MIGQMVNPIMSTTMFTIIKHGSRKYILVSHHLSYAFHNPLPLLYISKQTYLIRNNLNPRPLHQKKNKNKKTNEKNPRNIENLNKFKKHQTSNVLIRYERPLKYLFQQK